MQVQWLGQAAFKITTVAGKVIVIPMHYLTNPSLPGTPAELNKALGNSSVKVLVMQPGEMLEF